MSTPEVNLRVQARMADDHGRPLPMVRIMRLIYTTRDPYQVQLRDPQAGDLVFERSLLEEALTRGCAGIGDIRLHLWGLRGLQVLVIERPGGSPVCISQKTAAEFLDLTFELVKPGTEDRYLDIDAGLGWLLGSAA